MSTYNFKMLTVAREARGLTQAQLVAKVPNLTQGNYSKMEKNLLTVTPETLNNIAKALDFAPEFFFYDKPLFHQGEYYYRKRSTMPRKQQIKLEAIFDLIRVWVEGLVSSVEIPDFSLPRIEVRGGNTPEEIAKKIRGLMRVPRGPIDKLVNLLEANGVIVLFLNDAPEKFDGTTVVTISGQHIIVVNNDMPNDRKRFTLSHEFGHILMHLAFAPIIDDNRDCESEANRFASEFLMPESDIRGHLVRFRFNMVGDLKLYWKVAKSAIIRRAFTLNYIDQNKYNYMMIELSRSGERKSEKIQVSLDEPQLLRLIAETHFNELEYSFEDLSKSVAINRDDFDHYILGKQKNISKLKIVL